MIYTRETLISPELLGQITSSFANSKSGQVWEQVKFQIYLPWGQVDFLKIAEPCEVQQTNSERKQALMVTHT